MRRRSVLVALGGAVSTAGCSGVGDGSAPTERPDGGSDDDPSTGAPDDGGGRVTSASATPRYAECSRRIVPYDQFPAELRGEIDAALDGRYEADRVHLQDAIDVTRSYVAVDGTYYDPAVTTSGESEVLTLRRVEPKALPSGRPITVEHRLDGERVITVEVVADDGTVLVETTMDLWPGGDVEFGRVARVGTHEFRVTVADGDEVETREAEPIRVVPSLGSVHFVVDSDGIRARRAVADAPICRFAP